MNNRSLQNVKSVWWLAGGCLFAVACLIFAGTGAALGWFAFDVGMPDSAAGTNSAIDAPARLRGNPIGQRAPSFTLQDVEGREHSLDDVHGRPVLINFWATWCGPCRAEMPIIEDVYQRYKDNGLVVLAIDVEENPALAKTFASWIGVSFTLLDDGNGDVAYSYRVTAFPTSFFVDRDGVIRAWQAGAMSESVLERHLAKIMK